MNDNINPGGELYCDTRFFGIERWYYGRPKDADLRIPDDILKSVCFLLVRPTNERGQEYDHYIGTAFFVIIDRTIDNTPYSSTPSLAPVRFAYLVTARHVIDNYKKAGYTQFYVRLNTNDKDSKVIPIPDEWEYPDDKAADVAVLPFLPDSRVFELYAIPTILFIGPHTISHPSLEIGVGDELFIVGLFSRRYGYRRNIPIVRAGIISAMPDEPLVQETEEDEEGEEEPYLYYDAYLAEIKSISGLSGSPVFILFPPGRLAVDPLRPGLSLEDRWIFMLLGLVRGHWSVDQVKTAGDSEPGEVESFNTGIAEVTPIEEASKVIFGRKLVEKRKEQQGEYRRKHAPTQDAVPPPERPLEPGVTREGFEEALRRSSRKIPSEPESGKSET
ncbi:MAG TPA: serine protease [Pyrinomonadaceae bacterium]|nr:serine protease [Pyrinomonadaceae bacterium]